MTSMQLRYFVEVVKQKSYTKAADRLFVSQSTLSKAIRALETEMQAQLIDRNTRSFTLTREGRLVHEYAQNILDYCQAQEKELFQRLHDTGGTLRIGVPPTAGTVYFYSALLRFRQTYPLVDLIMTETPSKSICEHLSTGALDLGVVLEPFEDEKYCKRPVYVSEVMLVVSKDHPLADKKVVSFSELREQKFLMMSPEFMYHDMVVNKCREAGFEPSVGFYSSQWELIFEMAANSQDVALIPLALLNQRDLSRVALLQLKEPSFPWTLSLIYRRDKFITAPMRYFLDMCPEVR